MRQRIRLAILECDTPVPSVDDQYGGYRGVFKALLDAGAKAEGHLSADDVLEISAYQVVEEPDVYPDLNNIDALLLTGSKHDSFADSPWTQKLVKFTTEALQHSHIRIIGVCFGHQIIARALGVKVGRNPGGWEAAVHDVQLTSRGKEIFNLDKLRIHQMHRDVVLSLPEGVESLGSSPVCQNQGMYKARQILTVQGHPEFTSTIVREIIEVRHNTGVFDDDAYKTHIQKADLPHDGITVSRSFLKFLSE